MKQTALNRALKSARITQALAAELLDVEKATVSRRATGASDRPGELQFLAAVWPELDEAARERVRARLAEMRAELSAASGRP